MRYIALAAGYDGTLARDGRYDARCIESLRELSATGRKLILVTGRMLRDLLEAFPQARLFDYIVAENGAVMYCPATRQSEILAEAPPEMLVQELERRRVAPMSIGSSSIMTRRVYEPEIRDALRKLDLDFQMVANDGVLSVLPAGVDKAFGVWAALRELSVSPRNLAAIGDGDNDCALFALAEYAAAVRNASPSLQHVADRVTAGGWSDGFLELAHELVESDLASITPRRKVRIGFTGDGREISFAPARESIVVCGPRGAGKAGICEEMLHQLLAHQYQCCVLEAESSGAPCVRPGVTALGEPHEAPRLTDALTALERPDASVSINLAALAAETRPLFAEALLLQLQALHDRVGRPHCILINEAHGFLSAGFSTATPRLAEVTIIYATSAPQLLPSEVVRNVQLIVAAGEPSGFAWLRGELRGGAMESAQATTAGGACPISVFRPGASGGAVSAGGEAAVSGY